MTAECYVAMGAEHFVARDAEYFVARGSDSFVVGVAEYFGGAFLTGSAHHHPNLLHAPPHSCKWGNVVPMNTFLQPA